MNDERFDNSTIREGYYLPSEGKIYDVPVNSLVELRSMTAREEMRRLSPSVAQFKIQADIIEACMLEKPAVHVYDMCLGDYEYLLHKLRIVTYGDEYKMTANCPHCGEQVETLAHLEDLEVKELDMEKIEAARAFTLPRSGDSITLKFQTPRMLDEMAAKTKEMKRKYKDVDISFDDLVLLSTVIDTINGAKFDSVRMEAYINKMPAMDMLKIQNKINELNECVGLNTILPVTCPKCQDDFQVFFRYGPEFFRPTNI